MAIKDVHRGEVYQADLGHERGSETNHTIVLIVQNDVGNFYSPTTIVVPLEGKKSAVLRTQYEFTAFDTEYCACAEKIRVVDKSRLLEFIGQVNEDVIAEVTKRIDVATDFVKGEIYWADLGATVGSEQWGVRPVLVVQAGGDLEASQTTIVIPLTSRRKLRLPTHHRFYAFHRRQTACAEQIRVLEKDKLKEPLGALSPWDRDAVKRCCRVAVGEFIVGKQETMSNVGSSQ